MSWLGLGDAAVSLDEAALVLRFPTGEFCDVRVDGLHASRGYSDAGTVKVRRWSAEQIDRFYVDLERWDRYGRYAVKPIKWAHREPAGRGLYQRLARRLRVPLRPPVDRSALITNCMVDGR